VPPFIEDYTEPRPQDPYGIGKLCAEDMLTNLCELHDMEWVIAVPHNIIGPRQKYDDPFRNVASIMINLMLQGRPPVIYGDGTQKRCFSFIDDCLFCLKKMAFQEDVVGQVINIGPDEEVVTIYELFQTIQRLLKTELVPIYMPGRPAEVHHAVCCSSKARAYLDYKTNTTLMAGLSKMIEHIRQRGPKKFEYHLPIEIQNERTPKTWTEKIF